jgi:hypothetical protein
MNHSSESLGLICTVFRAASFPDCTNGGISSRCDVVTLIGLGKKAEIFAATPERPAVRLVKRTIYGKEYLHAEVLDRPKGMVGPMAGGNFIYCSDSRFSSSYPLSLHDRFETPEHYDALTR